MPFVTGWMGENHFAPLPTAFYGVVLFASAIAFTILQRTLVAHLGANSKLAAALGNDAKGKISATLFMLRPFPSPLSINGSRTPFTCC